MSRRGWLIFTAIILVLGIILTPYYLFVKNTLKISIFRTFFPGNSVRQINSQTNILILGIPGGTHDGPTLSDSMVVANYDFSSNRLATIGIPRDIWSDTLQDKINSAYAYGEAKQENGGMKLARAEIGSIIGVPIEYTVVINFSEFEQLIDSLGGVDVEVQRTFVDHKFPIPGRENADCSGDPDFKCRYETISFNKGLQHMNGETALKFVRSRNAEGAEGSDFARTQRQELVLAAVKNKLFGQIKSLNPGKWSELYKAIDKLIARDITNQQVAVIVKNIIFKGKFTQDGFHFPQGLFRVPDPSVYYGKYVLIPEDGNFDRVHQYFNCVLTQRAEDKCLSSKEKEQ